MKEYEIYDNNIRLGIVKLYENNINNNINNSIIEDNKMFRNIIFNKGNKQTYLVSINVNDIDELYDVVSKYNSDNVYEEIDNIKKYNNIKSIKKNTKLDIIVKENDLYLFNKSIKDINIDSLINSKIYFIDNVIDDANLVSIKDKLDIIKNDYDNKKSSSTYEFLLEEEKENVLKDYLISLDKLIKFIEDNTNYKYGIDYVISIKID